ncbi:hypothetical protein M0M57_13685 [Flavobacterium azooxidireducens]|uniref:Chloroplast import component protein (Tic20) n=1 Tax=Flavobacterium azooxidireducens TaxID=1871076 RepID=A0ABY4KD64_9FLAO|nr:hypothetical protein [Flavobacterium azooxidireducens]UPQ78664.1 hypothetical protein M0M57_13685 [Flavobacterium azooxidireducens]
MEQNKNAAIVAYLTIIGSVIAIFMNSENKSSFASFHIRQALGIFLTFFALGYPIGYFDSWMISFAFYIFFFILWIFGFMGALNNEEKKVPLLGDFYQNIFKSL